MWQRSTIAQPICTTRKASGPIPCAGVALIGSEAIGKQVIESIGSSKAVLLKQHGVFTIGETATAAVKAAVMV
jgi:L-ribulose-5-phosphate 4-epimerase